MKTKDKLTKNRLIWSIAIVLIAASIVPAAYAQTGESSMFFVLINSAVVAVVLFILQALLIRDPNAKERTGSYIWVLLLSLLIGFLFGRSGYIWQGYFGRYFNIYTIVNAIIIGTVIYTLLGFKVKMDSPEGKGGYTILIFIVSLIFAVNIGPHWIWELSTVKRLWVSLVGPDGLLNPNPPAYRLWVFLGGFTLMAYFFVGYLAKDIPGGNFVNYGISLAIAASMAHAGVGLPTIIKIAEIVFWIILADALKGGIERVEFKWGLSYVIVGWVSASVTAALGKEYQGIIGGMMAPMLRYYGVIPTAPGDPVGFGGLIFTPISFILLAIFIALWAFGGGANGWVKNIGKTGVIIWGVLLGFAAWSGLGTTAFGKIGLFVLIPAAILILILIGMGRGERRADGMWRGLKRYGLVPFLRRMRTSPNSLIKWILGKITLRDPYFEGELPPVFKDIRAELMMLMNYQTRLHTYFGKRVKVLEFGEQARIIEEYFETSAKTYDAMRNSIDRYRFGGKDTDEGTYGWSNNRQLIALFFSMLKENLEGNLKAPITAQTRDEYSGPLTTGLNNQLSLMKRAYEQFKTNVKRIGLIHRLRSLKIKLLDLLALYGMYKHSYRFANENALFEKWDWKLEDDEVVPTKRDNNYEKEKEEIIENIKKDLLVELRQKKQKEMIERIYREYYNQMLARFEPVFREGGYTNEMRQAAMKDIMNSVYSEELKKRNKDIIKEALSELESEETEREIIKRMPSKYKLGIVNTSAGELRHEVDIKGFVLENINNVKGFVLENIKMEADEKNRRAKGIMPYLKRIKIEDIEDFAGDPTKPQLATFEFIIPKIISEWDFLLEDLRFGTFHPFSRSHIDYTTIIDQQKSLNFDNVGRTKPDREQGHAAFDLEALKISGKFVYWGRRNYWDTFPELKNFYPTISTIGLSRFITSVVRLRIRNNEIENRYLSYWVWDTARMDEPFTSVLGKEGGT